MNKIAEAGLGSLIAFLGIILAIAFIAGIVVQSGPTLQARSFVTGSQPQVYSDSAVIFEEIFVTSLNQIELVLRVAPGSRSIPLEAITFEFVLDNVSSTYSLGNSASTLTFVQTGSFEVVSEKSTKVALIAPRDLLEKENFRIISTPRNAQVSQVFSSTGLLSLEKTQLFP